MSVCDACVQVVLLVALLVLALCVLRVVTMPMTVVVVMVVAMLVATGMMTAMIRFSIGRCFSSFSVDTCLIWYTRTTTVRCSHYTLCEIK